MLSVLGPVPRESPRMIVIPIRVISKNIRYATDSPFPGEELWRDRKSKLIDELKFSTLHSQSALICCQEVLHAQLEDILTELRRCDDWNYVGWGRDDGLQGGEYAPIFYRPASWNLLEETLIWFSPTPAKPSKDPDAGSVRILTRAKLEHKSTGGVVVVYCTHLDDQSGDARLRAAHQIRRTAQEDKDFPIIMAGDFNSTEDQEAYQAITSEQSFYDAYKSSCLRYGNTNTATGFSSDDGDTKRIDFIFYSEPLRYNKKNRLTVQAYAALSNRFDDGIYNSDHRAVAADLLLRIDPKIGSTITV